MAAYNRTGLLDQTILHTIHQLQQPNPEVTPEQAMWRAFSELWVNGDWTGFEWAMVEKVVIENGVMDA